MGGIESFFFLLSRLCGDSTKCLTFPFLGFSAGRLACIAEWKCLLVWGFQLPSDHIPDGEIFFFFLSFVFEIETSRLRYTNHTRWLRWFSPCLYGSRAFFFLSSFVCHICLFIAGAPLVWTCASVKQQQVNGLCGVVARACPTCCPVSCERHTKCWGVTRKLSESSHFSLKPIRWIIVKTHKYASDSSFLFWVGVLLFLVFIFYFYCLQTRKRAQEVRVLTVELVTCGWVAYRQEPEQRIWSIIFPNLAK